MEIAVVVLAVVVVVLLFKVMQQQKPTDIQVVGAPQPTQGLTPEQIQAHVSAAANEALTQAMTRLNAEAREVREESIKLAGKQIADAAQNLAETSADQLGRRAEVINTSMKSVEEQLLKRIADLDKQVTELREHNTQKFGNVDTAVNQLISNTSKLNEVLSSSQARGQWGERMAEDMMKAAGLVEGINYDKQSTIESGRPDFTVHLPPDRVLYMDVKFPIDAYSRYVGATDDGLRRQYKDEFLKAVRDRVIELQRRDYQVRTKQHALDYVLLFVPNESINGFVHDADPTMMDWALERRVVLCSPLTLYSFLAVVRQAADSFRTEEAASQVLQQISKFRDQWKRYVEALTAVKKKYDTLGDDLESLTVGTRFKGLERESRKMDEIRAARGIAALPSGDDDIVDADVVDDDSHS